VQNEEVSFSQIVPNCAKLCQIVPISDNFSGLMEKTTMENLGLAAGDKNDWESE
jgi:hypothetical protein